MLLLLVTLLATTAPALADEDVTIPVDAVTNEGADAEMLIRTAAQRMAEGDYDGAELLLDAVDEDVAPNLRVEADYQRANVRTLQRRYAEARDLYQGVLDDHGADSHRALDARFKVAELTGVTGDPQSALKALKALRKADGLEPQDRAKIALNRAIFLMETGEAKKGAKAFRKAMKKTPTTEVGYYEAKAWATLMDVELDRVDELPLTGSLRRMAKTLDAREQAIMHAGDAMKQITALKEPEWALAGLHRLALSFEDFGDDLLTAPEPELTPDQLTFYREGISERAEQAWIRAVRFLDAGVELGERLDWASSRVEALRRDKARIMKRIEAG